MSKEFYVKILNFMNSHHNLKRATVLIAKAITYFTYVYAILLVAYSFFFAYDKFIYVLLVPSIAFLAVSIIRYFINAPRPYEKYNITPLYNKKTKGKSFPSRHTFSIFIIAFTSFLINIPLGIIFTVLGIILAVSRILCGVHFIKDVLAGFVCACISALFFLL